MSDDFILNDDGSITFEFDGIKRQLKRPTLGQYREAVESLGSMRDVLMQQITDGRTTKLSVQIDVLMDWIDKIFLMLAGEGLPKMQKEEDGQPVLEDGRPVMVVDENRLPAWLLGSDIVQSMIQHWQTIPSHRGSR